MGPQEWAEAQLDSEQMGVGASGKTCFPNTLFELWCCSLRGHYFCTVAKLW